MITASDSLPVAARWPLASVFITNVGNGMHTLAVGKLLFDRTGSAAAFGEVIIAEYIINFIVQIFAGSIADRHQPKVVVALTDTIRGVFILVASLMLSLSYNLFGWLFASVLVINIGKPFYRSATFSIGPAIASGYQLVRYNAYYDGLQQGGQLFGLALVGLVIRRHGVIAPFVFNGFSFLIAAAAIRRAAIPELVRTTSAARSWLGSVLEDWREVARRIRTESTLGIHITLAGVDFLAVNLLALVVIPLVGDWYRGSPYWMSAFNGSFAVGAVLGAAVLSRTIVRLGQRVAAPLGLFGQAFCFLLLCVVRVPYISVAILVSMGMFNSMSFTCFTSTLQQRSRGPIKGRIVAARNLTTGALAVVLVPLVTHAQKLATAYALQTCAAILAGFAVATLALGSERMFGRSLLGLED